MLNSDEIIIREYRDGDEDQINRLHNHEYGISRNLAQWEWEFKNGPCGRAILVVAECNGKIIGTQALLPVVLSGDGQEILSAKSEETLVDSEFRGRGIFRQLYVKCFDLAVKRGIKLIWGFTRQVDAFSRIGFQIPGRMSYAIVILSPSRTYHIIKGEVPANIRRYSILRPALMLSLRVFSLCGSLWFKIKSRQTRLPPQCRIELIKQSDARLDVFRQVYAQKKTCTIARTSQYLDWRIFRNPYMQSQLIAVTKNSRVLGYVIISKKQDRGFISDFCVLDEAPSEIAAILTRTAMANLRAQGVACIYTWYADNKNADNSKYMASLKKAGGLSLPVVTPVVIKSLYDKGAFQSNLTDIDQWYITYLFSEGTG